MELSWHGRIMPTLQALPFSAVLPQPRLETFLPANLHPNLSTVVKCAVLIGFMMQGIEGGESSTLCPLEPMHS